MTECFSGIYKNKTVLVTGHTGFKGSWLVYWLRQMGANVIGYSLEPPTTPNHISLLDLDITSIVGNIQDLDKLNHTFQQYKPDIIFHLAAQSLVRKSYQSPIETYQTNVIGTLNVFESAKNSQVRAIVNITSDKAYDNQEWVWGYRENDPMGGCDPYSSSKGCAELLTASYRHSYFNNNNYKKTHNTLLASCRAGNVIGGGDWAKDRIMTDIMLATSQNKKVPVRNPNATRPWQHVLEPLSGYLQLGQKLLTENVDFAGAWNFGPTNTDNMPVIELVKNIKKHWHKIQYQIDQNTDHPHEANLLNLDSTKAQTLLDWQAVWNAEIAIKKTAQWYQAFYEKEKITTKENLESYLQDAKNKKLTWIKK